MRRENEAGQFFRSIPANLWDTAIAMGVVGIQMGGEMDVMGKVPAREERDAAEQLGLNRRSVDQAISANS